MSIPFRHWLGLSLSVFFFFFAGKHVAQGTWVSQSSGTSQHLYSLHFSDANTGWIAGANGVVRNTTNGGSTWTGQSAGTQWHYGMTFLNANTGWMSGSTGLIYKTTNGGASWTSYTGAGVPLWGIGFKDANVGFAGGQFTMVKTTDGGVTWTTFAPGGPSTYYFDIKFLATNTNIGWAVGSGGRVRYTTNGGDTWTVVSAGSQYLREVFFIDSNTGWVVGDNGVIYKSVNGGVSWTSQSSGTANSIYGCHFLDANTGWAVGTDGLILYTSNGGSTWVQQSSPVTTTLNEVFFADASNGWIVGINGVLLKYSPPPPVPSCTALSSPLNGATNVPVNSALSWTAAGTATGYNLIVGTTPGGTDILNNFDVGNVTTYDPPGEFPFNTTIYVTIIPYNASGNATGCLEENFTTTSTCVPLIEVPANGALLDNGCTPPYQNTNLSEWFFDWTDCAGATFYHLWVKHPAAQNPYIDSDTLTASELLYSQYGYTSDITGWEVKVRAFINGDWSLWSPIVSFNVEPPGTDCPPVCNSSLTNPANGATNVPVTTALTWNASGDVTGYLLVAGISSGGSDILDSVDVGNVTTYDPPGNLPYSTTIYVTVIPYNDNGNAVGCMEKTFTTENFPLPGCVNLVSPVHTQANVQINTNLSWSVGSGQIDGYLINIGTSPAADEIISNLDVGNVLTYNPSSNFPNGGDTIFVKIFPYNIGGQNTSCPTEFFTTSYCPVLVYPLNGSTNFPVKDSIRWTAYSNASNIIYQLTLSTGSGTSLPIQNIVDSVFYDPIGALPYAQEIKPSMFIYQNQSLLEVCPNTESFFTEPKPLTGPFTMGTGLNSPPEDLLLHNNGNLYAGGSFTQNACRFGVWNNIKWSPVPQSCIFDQGGDEVKAVVQDANGNIYVGGKLTRFWNFGYHVPLKNVAWYNGSSWAPLGGGFIDGIVNGMCVTAYQDVVAVGSFLNATGGLTVNRVALWDGYSWEPLGSGLNGTAICVLPLPNGNIVVGGQFTMAGGVPVQNIAMWDGSQWSAMGNGLNNVVWALHRDDNGDIYAGGQFTSSSNVPMNRVAKWDGSTWYSIGTGSNNGVYGQSNAYVRTIVTDAYGNLYVGGYFNTAGGVPVSDLAKWNGNNWEGFSFGSDVYAVSIKALETDKDQNLYISGGIGSLNDDRFRNIIGWNIVPNLPDCSQLINPANGSQNVSPTTIIQWENLSGAPDYLLSIGLTPGGSEILDNYLVSGASYQHSVPFPSLSQIFIRIIPVNAYGQATGCVEESFTTGAQPDCTMLTDPVNAATSVPVTTALTWAASTTATGYKLSIGTTPGGTDILNNVDVGNVTTYDPTGNLPYNVIIYVKITPYNAIGDADSCAEESFTTGSCIPNLLVVSNPVPAGAYHSLGDLISHSSTVANGTAVIFTSDTGILLDYNFTVESGATFHAYIQACNNFKGDPQPAEKTKKSKKQKPGRKKHSRNE